MKDKRTSHSPSAMMFITYAIILALVFWTIEAALHTFLFHQEDNFYRHLFMPSFHELWMRLLVVALTIFIVLLYYYVSRYRQAEDALKQSEEKFHSLFNQASESIFLLRPTEDDLIIEDVNDFGCNIHGYTRQELIGTSIGLLDDPETRRHIPERISLLRSGKALNVEAMHVRKNGSLFPIEIAAKLIHIGETPYVLAIDRDITKRKKDEEALRVEKEKFKTYVNISELMVVVIDRGQRVSFINKKACEILGYSEDEIIGKNWFDHFLPDRMKSSVKNVHAKLLEGKIDLVKYFENNVLTKSGEEKLIAWYNTVLRDSQDKIIATLGSGADITAKKKAEVELNERMKLAELSADTGIAFTTSFTLMDALQKSSQSLVDHLDALFARIWLFNERENILELKASAGLYTHIDGGHSRIPYGKFKIGNIAKECKPHLTNYVAGDPDVSDQEWVRKEKIVSFAGHPLMLRNRLIGVMAMFSRSVLSDIALRALSSVADQIAIGIDQKLKEEQVRRSKDQWETTFDTIPDIVIVIDSNHRILRTNNALSDRLGVSRDEIVGKPCYRVVHGTSEPPSYCPHVAVLADGKERMEEIFEEHLNGYFQFSATPILDPEGNATATVHVARDITRRKEMEEKLKEAAITDELTGLLNRRGFFALAEQQCRLSDRTKRGMSLLYIDLDGMKNINDELGHQAGDQALSDLASVLKSTFRGSDIIARMGGDEFAVLLTEPAESVEPVVMNHLRRNISEHNKRSRRNFALMISVGSSHYDPLHPCSVEDLLMRADTQMYEDKSSHKYHQMAFARNSSVFQDREYTRIIPERTYPVTLFDSRGRSINGIEINNISAGGICIESPAALSEGTPYNVRLHCGESGDIRANVSVVWSSSHPVDNGKEADMKFRAGLKFKEMDRAMQKRLAIFLEALSEI